MKKVVKLFLDVVMMLSMCGGAFAENTFNAQGS